MSELSPLAERAEGGAGRYINRELSWLNFNRRVYEMAASERMPLLERLKFLAIFESNLDEFYMVRVSGLIEQYESGLMEITPDGLTPSEQLTLIAANAGPMRREAGRLLHGTLLPALEQEGVALRKVSELTPRQKSELQRTFHRELFPLCTPLLLHPTPSFPFISNRSLNLVVELKDDSVDLRLARIKVPTVIPRFLPIAGLKNEFVLLEEVLIENLQSFFPGVEVLGASLFRVIRDADVEIRELEAADLIANIEETLRLRRFGDPVLLEVADEMPLRIRKHLLKSLRLDEDDLFVVEGLLGMEALFELAKLDKPSLRYKPHLPHLPESLGHTESLFETIRSGDVLVHHPYDSFRPVETFVEAAVLDPKVIGIKQTLYRVGSESRIVESLLEAAREQKQVAVMVELKARFDESNNLVWARALERAGVHVTYGFPERKTHCKLCMIVRQETKGLRIYAHIGTGNYNPATARMYTDLGLFTDDPEITQDISELFNYLTGFNRQSEYRKLLVAPINLREGILERIEREVRSHRAQGGGRIVFKLNALVDPEVIEALYEASEAGVEIDLLIRGVCCLRPGVPGMSSRIRVRSVLGRFLEHSRIYFFGNGDRPEALIGSADLMRRNLDRRIEVLVPVEQPHLIEHLRDVILAAYLREDLRAWSLGPDGEYAFGEGQTDVQSFFMANPSSKLLIDGSAVLESASSKRT